MWIPTVSYGWPGTNTLEEAQRLDAELAAMCDLPEGQSTFDCGRAWCSYFDDDVSRCGLVQWQVSRRLGPAALRWFVDHRTTKTVEVKDVEPFIAARASSL